MLPWNVGDVAVVLDSGFAAGRRANYVAVARVRCVVCTSEAKDVAKVALRRPKMKVVGFLKKEREGASTTGARHPPTHKGCCCTLHRPR